MSRFQFVADHQDTFEVKRLCEVIEVNRSSFYAWENAGPARAERAQADEQLASRIRAVQDPAQGGDKAYGAPRVTAELNDGVAAEERVNRKRVARVMAKNGLAGIRLRRKVRTTIPEPSHQKVPDLVKRDFTAKTINTKYVGDITYLPLADGSNLYLATVIDCCSRKLAGWAVADHMRTELVEDALKAALADRGSVRGAVFHADHGSVYTSKDYAALCGQLGVISPWAAWARAPTTPSRSPSTPPSRGRPWPAPPPTATRHHAAASIPLGGPLQHQETPLLPRPGVPERLREHARDYHPGSRVIQHTSCPKIGGKAPSTAQTRCGQPATCLRIAA